MYSTVKKVEKFDTDKKDDLRRYEQLLNNPLCLVLDNMREKIITSEYNNGKLARTDTRIVFIVTYEKKEVV
jgi:hypothetical protein